MNRKAFIYSLKVWLTGAFLMLVYTWVMDSIYHPTYHNYFLYNVCIRSAGVVLLTLAFAIPFYICVLLVIRLDWDVSLLKLLLSAISFILGWLPVMAFVILTDNLDRISPGREKQVLVYLFLNFVCIWFYNLKGNTLNHSKTPVEY